VQDKFAAQLRVLLLRDTGSDSFVSRSLCLLTQIETKRGSSIYRPSENEVGQMVDALVREMQYWLQAPLCEHAAAILLQCLPGLEAVEHDVVCRCSSADYTAPDVARMQAGSGRDNEDTTTAMEAAAHAVAAALLTHVKRICLADPPATTPTPTTRTTPPSKKAKRDVRTDQDGLAVDFWRNVLARTSKDARSDGKTMTDAQMPVQLGRLLLDLVVDQIEMAATAAGSLAPSLDGLIPQDRVDLKVRRRRPPISLANDHVSQVQRPL
jgi:hypothetical protein